MESKQYDSIASSVEVVFGITHEEALDLYKHVADIFFDGYLKDSEIDVLLDLKPDADGNTDKHPGLYPAALMVKFKQYLDTLEPRLHAPASMMFCDILGPITDGMWVSSEMIQKRWETSAKLRALSALFETGDSDEIADRINSLLEKIIGSKGKDDSDSISGVPSFDIGES